MQKKYIYIHTYTHKEYLSFIIGYVQDIVPRNNVLYVTLTNPFQLKIVVKRHSSNFAPSLKL